MTNVTKILLSLIFASTVAPAKISVAQAITITNGSKEFELLDSAPGGIGLENDKVRISGLDSGPESLSISETRINCDLDPKACDANTAASGGSATTANSSVISTGSTAGDAAEISEPTALLLLILGLIGLSRLRGRPID